ncbi:hypothetical protein ACSNOI_24310 [Actinomadura kijaniata]|uniref:hypothetical protein n=1 Tax=Actinomadura kijaniata TaxID=46161 RepID=UPI003F196EBD
MLAIAATLRTRQRELHTTKESQVTDRYTKAAGQLGSDGREVRTAAVYALERIAAGSPRDRLTIRDVLAAYIREHDPASTVKTVSSPPNPIPPSSPPWLFWPAVPDPGRAEPLDLHTTRVF